MFWEKTRTKLVVYLKKIFLENFKD